jgi:hypothetical protein
MGVRTVQKTVKVSRRGPGSIGEDFSAIEHNDNTP